MVAPAGSRLKASASLSGFSPSPYRKDWTDANGFCRIQKSLLFLILQNLTLLQNGGSVRQETSLLPLAPGEDELAIDKDERENTNRRWGSSENTKCQRSRQ